MQADTALPPSGSWGVFSERLPLQAGVMRLQQRPLGLADEENDDASSGSGERGRL